MRTSILGFVASVAVIGLIAAFLPGVVRSADDASDAAPAVELKPTLVINLTSGQEDLHAAMMGLHFAEHGLAAGRDVVIFFNVKAPPLACKDLDESVQLGDMPPVDETIARLREQGAKMVVCPMCAKITGVTADQLAPGIEMLTDRKQIFDHLHGNTVVFSY